MNNNATSQQTTAAGSNGSAALDREVLARLAAVLGDEAPQVIGELVDLFSEETPRLLADMQSALADDDGDRLRRAAHSLKSSSANMGALRLSELCADMERLGQSNSFELAAGLLLQIQTEYEDVAVALAQERASRL